MEVFGPEWKDYIKRIEKNWKKSIRAEDLILIAGDISWAMRFEDAMKDPRARYLVVAFGKMILREVDNEFAGVFEHQDLALFSAHNGTIVLLGWDKNGAPWLGAQSGLEEEELPAGYVGIDFRSIYAGIAKDWLQVDPGRVVEGDFEPIKLV